MFDFEVDAELLVILAKGANAVGADREHLLRVDGLDSFDVLIGQGLENEVVAKAASGVSGAAFFLQHAEGNVVVAEHLNERGDYFASGRVVATHAAEPK